jgi:hypothetical protein
MVTKKHSTSGTPATTAPKAECPNVSYSKGRGVSMDAERTQRLCNVLYRISRAVHSLNAAASTFDQDGDEPGEENMCPRTTVRAFTRPMAEDIALVYRMLDHDEPEQAVQQGGA